MIFGAVGGPKWDKVPYEQRPEAGLLRLRKDLAVFANLRPAICYPALADASSLKRELVEGLDILIVRELTGGVYFGEPKNITDLGDGQKRAVDTQVYETYEIDRIVRVAFDLARTRNNKVHSADKKNVMKSGVLWDEVASRASAKDYPMSSSTTSSPTTRRCSWCATPSSSTSWSPTTCSATSCPTSPPCSPARSACCPRPRSARPIRSPASARRFYEPVHGSAPDIAGKGIANPIAMLAIVAMALRYSFDMVELADQLESAISAVLGEGLRTGDIAQDNRKTVGTEEMGAAILSKLAA